MAIDAELQDLLRQAWPQMDTVLGIASYRPGYLPFPALARVRLVDGSQVAGVIKAGADAQAVEREALALGILADLDFPAPRVLAGPAVVHADGRPIMALVMSELAGKELPWIDLHDLDQAHRTCRLVGQAVDALHALTPQVLAHPDGHRLRTIMLADELQAIIDGDSPWLKMPAIARAVELLGGILPRYTLPLVFSNGDYNPINFMGDGTRVTGWLDFEHACLEDPLIGLAKFMLWADDDYGWGAGAKAGLVERYLYGHGIAPEAFWVRVVLRGLWHLQGCDPADPPNYMLDAITEAAQRLAEFHR